MSQTAPAYLLPPGTPVRLGLVVDVETPGLDPWRDEIIEIAMTPFTSGLDGAVFSVDESFQGLRQPTEPISPEITTITGITNEIVADQVIDPAAIARFAAPASLVIAHNAAFDRRFLERFSAGCRFPDLALRALAVPPSLLWRRIKAAEKYRMRESA